MSQASGILIMSGGILVVLLFMLLLKAKLKSKRAKKKPALFDAMHRAVEEAVPQAKGYPVVMAQAEKDTMSLLKEAGGDFAKQFAVAAVGAVLECGQIYIPMEITRPNSFWPTGAMKFCSVRGQSQLQYDRGGYGVHPASDPPDGGKG